MGGESFLQFLHWLIFILFFKTSFGLRRNHFFNFYIDFDFLNHQFQMISVKLPSLILFKNYLSEEMCFLFNFYLVRVKNSLFNFLNVLTIKISFLNKTIGSFLVLLAITSFYSKNLFSVFVKLLIHIKRNFLFYFSNSLSFSILYCCRFCFDKLIIIFS